MPRSSGSLPCAARAVSSLWGQPRRPPRQDWPSTKSLQALDRGMSFSLQRKRNCKATQWGDKVSQKVLEGHTEAVEGAHTCPHLSLLPGAVGWCWTRHTSLRAPRRPVATDTHWTAWCPGLLPGRALHLKAPSLPHQRPPGPGNRGPRALAKPGLRKREQPLMSPPQEEALLNTRTFGAARRRGRVREATAKPHTRSAVQNGVQTSQHAAVPEGQQALSPALAAPQPRGLW